jgi:predicted Fe-Mo cluster-binding NifX family protein
MDTKATEVSSVEVRELKVKSDMRGKKPPMRKRLAGAGVEAIVRSREMQALRAESRAGLPLPGAVKYHGHKLRTSCCR